MENASKALIIAGAILLSIAIIGVGMYVFTSVSDTIKKASNMSDQEIDAYNSTFEDYEGVQSGSQAKALCDKVRGHNNSVQDGSELISVSESGDVSVPAPAGDTEKTSYITMCNDMKKTLYSGKQYNISFGYDPDTGLLTAVYIAPKK